MSDLPNELLLEVFQLLPQSALAHICATSKLFFRPGRPLLFAHLEASKGLSAQTSQDDQTYGDLRGRVEFWTSPRISDFVRSCSTLR